VNVALNDQWLRIDAIYNFQGKTSKNLADFDKARIIHFVGNLKPNFVGCKHAATPIFLEHRRYTPWAEKGLRTVWQRRLTKWAGGVSRTMARVKRRYGMWARANRRSVTPAARP
jgi:lipopolysaccharide biosynthesis glycosyltransferase